MIFYVEPIYSEFRARKWKRLNMFFCSLHQKELKISLHSLHRWVLQNSIIQEIHVFKNLCNAAKIIVARLDLDDSTGCFQLTFIAGVLFNEGLGPRCTDFLNIRISRCPCVCLSWVFSFFNMYYKHMQDTFANLHCSKTIFLPICKDVSIELFLIFFELELSKRFFKWC